MGEDLLESIAQATNVRVVGGCCEKVVYWVLLLIGVLIFLVAAPGILGTFGESSIMVNRKMVTSMDNPRSPSLALCFDQSYQKHIADMNITGLSPCSSWELYTVSYADNSIHCLKSEKLSEELRNLVGGHSFCYSWDPVKIVPSRYALGMTFKNMANNKNDFTNNRNMLVLFDSSKPGWRSSFDFTAVGFDTTVDVQMVFDEDSDKWTYEPMVNSHASDLNPFASTQTSGRLTVKISDSVRVEKNKSKGPSEVYAELGGAWGGAMLFLGICFMQKSVPGKEKTSPAHEVQVFRLRRASNREQLLSVLAGMLQSGKTAYEENAEHVEKATTIGAGP